MSSYGEKRDRADEQFSKDMTAMQSGIQGARSRGPRGSSNKKKDALLCLIFLIFLVLAIVAVIIINLA